MLTPQSCRQGHDLGLFSFCVCTSYSPYVKWSQKHPLFPRKATVISYEVDTRLLAYKTSFQIAILLAMTLSLRCKFACFDHPSEELTVQMCSYSKILYTPQGRVGPVGSSGVGKSHTPICSHVAFFIKTSLDWSSLRENRVVCVTTFPLGSNCDLFVPSGD